MRREFQSEPRDTMSEDVRSGVNIRGSKQSTAVFAVHNATVTISVTLSWYLENKRRLSRGS